MSAEEEISFTWTLGEDFNCDLCGPTFNEVGLECWDEEEEIWQLYIRVGCYEGDSVMSNSPEWPNKSADIMTQASWYSNFTEDKAKELRDRLALIKGIN